MDKSIKELLQLVLETGERQVNNGTGRGLCSVSQTLYRNNLINYYELLKLSFYIKSNRPQIGEKYYSKAMKNSDYFWKIGWWSPRKQWLTDQIKLL